MLDLGPEVRAQLRAALVAGAGGYLRNPVRESRVTCAVCTTPCVGYEMCHPCLQHRRAPGARADRVAALTYAVQAEQSGYVMRGYKAEPRPVAEHRNIVALLCLLGLAQHGQCAGRLAGTAVTHWMTVPSLPPKPGEHPLRRLVAQAAAGQEVRLTAQPTLSPRAFNAAHFSCPPLPHGAHVLVLDDTWAGGGHAQSAAAAARAAGATQVSVLVVARWIDPAWSIDRYGTNAAFLKERCAGAFDPTVCPWTAGACP